MIYNTILTDGIYNFFDGLDLSYGWVCVFAATKISNNIGVSTTIEDDYLIDRIEETPGGDVTESIDTTFNIGEINQIEDE